MTGPLPGAPSTPTTDATSVVRKATMPMTVTAIAGEGGAGTCGAGAAALLRQLALM